MNRFYHLLLLISGLTVALSPSVNAQTKSGAEANGILYRISGKGLTKPSYLFGTVHVICSTDMFS